MLRGPPLMSPDVDRHAASSLELSPSNSSGGTYMWDEEGMEPLGQNTHIHRCSSYESELNSIVSTHISSQNCAPLRVHVEVSDLFVKYAST